MPTVQQVLDKLVEADDELTKAYSRAPANQRVWIDFCARAIEGVIKDIVRSDLHSRTGQIQQLTKEIKGGTQDLQALKTTIQQIVAAAQIAQKALNALSALLPLL